MNEYYPVSYTHLDVYKRQEYYQYLFQMKNWMIIVVVYLYVVEDS